MAIPKKARAVPETSKTQASALWTGHERFLTTGSSGHALVLDSDRALNSAPGPVEMVLRSLCACSATDMVLILAKARQSWSRLEVSAEAERAPAPPAVFTRVHMVYRLVGARLDRHVVDRAIELSHSKYCSVFVMLHHGAKFTHEVIIEAPEA